MLSPFKTRKLLKVDPAVDFAEARNVHSRSGIEFETRKTSLDYNLDHTVSGGIERIHYRPARPNGRPALLMLHGMWHAAFCWENWQKALAKQGWESVAFSLPGHGRSPVQCPVRECSLSYYLRFVADEVEKFDAPPILFGHSMGGALAQWYLKYVGALPGMVFVASWTSHDILKDCMWSAMKVDPIGSIFSPFLGWRYQFRNDTAVRKWFLSNGANAEAQALRSQLGPESEIVLMQHRPAHWVPPAPTNMPMLWVCASNDAIVPVSASHLSAAYYAADVINVPETGHDIMLDVAAFETAEKIHNWLSNQFSATANM